MQSHVDWLDVNKPMGGGTLNARVVVPEIDGGMTPLCISTLNGSIESFCFTLLSLSAWMLSWFSSSAFMKLRTLSNKEKESRDRIFQITRERCSSGFRNGGCAVAL